MRWWARLSARRKDAVIVTPEEAEAVRLVRERQDAILAYLTPAERLQVLTYGGGGPRTADEVRAQLAEILRSLQAELEGSPHAEHPTQRPVKGPRQKRRRSS